MSFSPASFKTKLASAGGGARPSLYKVTINEGTATEETLTDIKSISYGHLVAYLIEAIKELKIEVDALKA